MKAVADGNLKNGSSPLTVSEAVWGMEAVMNTTYANAAMPFSKTSKRETLVTIPTANGYISDADLFAGVNDLTTELLFHYDSIGGDYKHPIVIDIEVANNTSNEITLSMNSIITEEPPIEEMMNTTIFAGGCVDFAPGNNWFWGFAQGRCGGFPSGANRDAADVLELHLNSRSYTPNLISFPTPIQSYTQSNSHLNPNDPVPGDGDRDYLMFYGEGNTIVASHCLSPDDMEFYYCGTIDVINQIVPSGESIITIDLYDDVFLAFPYQHVHRADIIHGVPVTCPCSTVCAPETPVHLCPQCC